MHGVQCLAYLVDPGSMGIVIFFPFNKLCLEFNVNVMNDPGSTGIVLFFCFPFP